MTMSRRSSATHSDANLIHPGTTLLVNRLAEAQTALISGDFIAGLRVLRILLTTLKPGDAPPELKLKIEQELKSQSRFSSQAASSRDMAARQYLYIEWLETLTGLLHDKGYFGWERWSANPTAGDKKSGAGKDKPLPAVMSSRIEEPEP